jgi:hypothetical protein
MIMELEYYCTHCMSTIKAGPESDTKTALEFELECPLCNFAGMIPIPENETVEEWEKRTGKNYPDTAPVYEKRFFAKPPGTTGWMLHEYKYALKEKEKYPKRMTHNIILVATDRGAPDYDLIPAGGG